MQDSNTFEKIKEQLEDSFSKINPNVDILMAEAKALAEPGFCFADEQSKPDETFETKQEKPFDSEQGKP